MRGARLCLSGAQGRQRTGHRGKHRGRAVIGAAILSHPSPPDPFSRCLPEVTRWVWNSTVSSPISSGVWGEAPAGKRFGALIGAKRIAFCGCFHIQRHLCNLLCIMIIYDTHQRGPTTITTGTVQHASHYIFTISEQHRGFLRKDARLTYVSHLWLPHTPITVCRSPGQRTIGLSMTARSSIDCCTWLFASFSRMIRLWETDASH